MFTRVPYYVFHVPQSEFRPHWPMDRDKRYFWKRTNAGCEQMTLEEIRALFLDTEGRRRLVALLYWHIQTFRITAELAKTLSTGKVPPPSPDIDVIDQIIPDLWPLLHGDPELVDLLLKQFARRKSYQRKFGMDCFRSLFSLSAASLRQRLIPDCFADHQKRAADRI